MTMSFERRSDKKAEQQRKIIAEPVSKLLVHLAVEFRMPSRA
jgi:hypothetical protein